MILGEYPIIFCFIKLYIQIITITIYTLHIQQVPEITVCHIMYLILDTIHTSAMVGTAMKMISFWAKVSTIYTESKLRVSILQLYLHNTIDHCNPILRFSVINLQIITTVTYIYILLRPVSSATSASDVLKSQSQFLIMKYSTHIGDITILI